MEASVNFNFAVLAPLAVLILPLSWKILNWVWLRPRKLDKFLRRQGLKGNSYRFPLGDIVESVKMVKEANSKPIGLFDDIVPRLLPFDYQHLVTYGKDFFMWIGPDVLVNIMHPNQIKDIFAKINEFQKPPANPLVKLVGTGLAAYEGKKWAMHRKIINPAFHLEKIKLMLPAFCLSCNKMVAAWEELVPTEGSFELDVWPDLQNMTRDVISRTAFGSSYEDGKRIFELQKELIELAAEAIQMVYIPGWRFFPTKVNRRMKNIDREIQSLLRGIISKKEMAIRAGEAATDDLLALLLESNIKEIQGSNNIGLSIEDIIEECKLFYFAGQETTSNLLVWTMVLLSVHPQWQARARDEVLQIFGKEHPNYDGLNRLNIVTMILYEVLRLYPPVPAIARTVIKDTKLGEVTIPGGVQVAMPTLLVHQDKDLWGNDAKEFNPERFSEGISKATKNQICFFPFGWGPRICVGQNFALIEAKMAMAMILQKFSFEISPSYSHAPTIVATLQPQHGAQLILHKYSLMQKHFTDTYIESRLRVV